MTPPQPSPANPGAARTLRASNPPVHPPVVCANQFHHAGASNRQNPSRTVLPNARIRFATEAVVTLAGEGFPTRVDDRAERRPPQFSSRSPRDRETLRMTVGNRSAPISHGGGHEVAMPFFPMIKCQSRLGSVPGENTPTSKAALEVQIGWKARSQFAANPAPTGERS